MDGSGIGTAVRKACRKNQHPASAAMAARRARSAHTRRDSPRMRAEHEMEHNGDECGQDQMTLPQTGGEALNSGNEITLQEGSCIGRRILPCWGCERHYSSIQEARPSAGFLLTSLF